LAERRAQLRADRHGFDPATFDLLSYELEITKQNLQEQTVANALADAAIPILWGKQVAPVIRDFIFEIVQNALTHGGAPQVLLRVTPKAITLTDYGAQFAP